MSRELKSRISINGYVELFNIRSLEEAIAATSNLSDILTLNGEVYQKLIPLDRNEAISRSFSSKYGYESFPLHTDTAFWITPARFVVFFMECISNTATNVLAIQDVKRLIEFSRQYNPIFTRKTTQGVIYSQPWTESYGGRFVYDPCYMKPENKAAKYFMDLLDDLSSNAQRICWSGEKVLILDNWHTLHGREKCDDMQRMLHRFYRGRKNELGK